MEVTELKTAWNEISQRCYSLYRIDGKTVRIRGIAQGQLIAEIFSTALRWEPITLPKIGHKGTKHGDQMITELLDEVKLILGDDDAWIHGS